MFYGSVSFAAVYNFDSVVRRKVHEEDEVGGGNKT
jgi:hypothetical protein